MELQSGSPEVIYRGVTHCPALRGKKWKAQISYRSKNVFLGYHTTQVEAARAYDRAAQTLFGNIAQLNFPRDK